MKKTTHNSIKLWAVLVWLLVWQGGSMLLARKIPLAHLLLPSPVSALESLAEMAATQAFWRSILWSTARIFGGFFAACLAASALAVPAYRFRLFRQFLAPAVSAVKAVPVASFIILALVWLRSDTLSIFISFLMVFPPVYLGVLTGIGQTDPKLLEMARVFHVPVWKQMSPFEKIDIEAQLTGYSSAGCITYVELDSTVKNNLEALELLVNYAMDKDIPYFAINVPNDTCLSCGFTDEFNDKCPECGSDNIQQLRRVTGYLTGNYTTAFNKGKQDEVRHRVKHTEKLCNTQV